MEAVLDEVIVMEDSQEEGKYLVEELTKRDFKAKLCDNIREVMQIADEIDSAFFAIDIDMGPGRRKEGLDAIEQLKRLGEEAKKQFRVAALTSHAVFRADAAKAGVDDFIIKDSSTKDALELITRALEARLMNQARVVDKHQEELAKTTYASLSRHLKDSEFRLALNSVYTAQSWPRLLEKESMLLAVLSSELEAINKGEPREELTSLLQRAASELEQNRARDIDVGSWIIQLRQQGSTVVRQWLDDSAVENFPNDL